MKFTRMVANCSIFPKLLAEWLPDNGIFVCVSSLRSLAKTINAVETGNNKTLIQLSMQVTQRKAWCVLRDKQVEQAVAPYKLSTPATWEVQCPQNEECKEFENFKLLVIKPLSVYIYTTRMKAALKMASDVHVLHSQPHSKLCSMLNMFVVTVKAWGKCWRLSDKWLIKNFKAFQTWNCWLIWCNVLCSA